MRFFKVDLDRIKFDIKMVKEETEDHVNRAFVSFNKDNGKSNGMFEKGDSRWGDPEAPKSQKKYMHKNMKLLAIDDMNLGDEVTYAINSQVDKLQDKQEMNSLAVFINKQMDRILLSKMNSEVSQMYIGNNRDDFKKKGSAA